MLFTHKVIQYHNDCEIYRLSNEPLVIDGTNTFWYTYPNNKLPFVFGAEANEYAKILYKNVIEKLEKANLNYFVIFKGGDDNIPLKVENWKARYFDFETNNTFFAPIFLKETLRQTLEDYGIKFATCLWSHKNDCLALAQKLQCPILSDNIGFCFTSVSPILKYRCTDNSITGHRFTLENYLKRHSITDTKMAILCVLTTTHIFPKEHFKELLYRWNVCDPNNNSVRPKTRLEGETRNLLRWLSKHDESEVLQQIKQYLSNDEERESFLNEMRDVLDTIRNGCEGGLVTDYLYNNVALTISSADPLWFEKGVATQRIAKDYINLFKHRRIRGSSAIESKKPTDSIMLSIDIIKYAYNLLSNFQTTDICVYQEKEQFVNVNTADTNVTKPRYQCVESVFENGWEDIVSLELFEHFLRENNIDTHAIAACPASARMLLISVSFAARHKLSQNIDVTRKVYCFIVCYVMLGVVRASQSVREELEVTEQDVSTAETVASKYFRYDEAEAKRIFDGEKLNTLAQLQYCLLHMNYLNELCGAPYRATRYAAAFNGTFIYKLLHAMGDGDAYLFLQNLFRRAPSVLNLINKLLTAYKDTISTGI